MKQKNEQKLFLSVLSSATKCVSRWPSWRRSDETKDELKKRDITTHAHGCIVKSVRRTQEAKMKEPNAVIVEQWERLKVLVASIEDDVLKNAKGNSSAGVRARKGLRVLKKEAHDLVQLTVSEAKKAAATE